MLGRLLLALLAEKVCEKIRPTQRYTWGAYVRINENPWEYRMGSGGRRRPWERLGTLPSPGDTMMDMRPLEGEIAMQEWMVRRAR